MADGQDPPLPVPGEHVPEKGYQGGAEFFMDYAKVPGLGKMLDQASEHARRCERFIRDNSSLKGGEGWLNQLQGRHEAVVDQAASWFGKLADPVLATSASHVDATIRAFQHAEGANAAAIDSKVPSRVDTADVSLPPWPKTTLEENVPYGPFEYLEEPDDALRGLRDYEGDPAYQYHPQIFDFVGPASVARATVVKVTEFMASLGWLDRAYDPFDVFVKPVVGDWAGIRRFADVLHYVGDSVERTGIGIDRARHMLGPVWRGRSADACVVWLGAVAKPMRDAPNALDAMADAYERAADGAVKFRGLLDSILTNVVDAAFYIAAALAIGAGGAPLTGGISAGVASLVAGGEIITLFQGIKDLLAAKGEIDTIMSIVAAAQADFGSIQGGGQLPHLPPVSGNAGAISALPT